MEYGYPADALTQESGTQFWHLVDGFDPDRDFWRIEAGAPGTTEVILRDGTGTERMRGTLGADLPLLLAGADGVIRLDRVEIEGELALYVPSDSLIPGETYPLAEPDWSARRIASPEEIAALPALGAGTMIATDAGDLPIDWLRPGDKVLTRDHGFQPLLWLDQHVVPRLAPDNCRPHPVPAGHFGPNRPTQDLLLTPASGLLMADPQLELYFGTSEMLAPVGTLAGERKPQPGRQVLYSLLFDMPELVLAGGLWMATVHAHTDYLAHLPHTISTALAPNLDTMHRQAARSWLVPWEIEAFLTDDSGTILGLAA